MCGRYAATAKPNELVEEFDIEFVGDVEPIASPRWNVAPTTLVPTVFVDAVDGEPARQLGVSRWGLTPPWAKDKPMNLINARVETVNEKPSFRRAIKSRRCILPAAGYYEWIEEPAGAKKVKQPYFLHPKEGSLAMAAIFEFHQGPGGWVRTTSILTTAAADEFGWVHDRMPMTVPHEAFGDWLDPALDDGLAAVALLEEPRLDRARKVSRAVNHIGNEGPELIAPVEGIFGDEAALPGM